MKKSKIQFTTESIFIHNNKYDYSKFIYKNNNTKSIIICKIHGQFLQTPHNHLSGQGCPPCGLESRKNQRSKSKQQFIREAKKIYNNYYDYSKFEYKNNKTKSIIICPKHGEFYQTPKHHIIRKQACNKCSVRPKRNLEEFISAAILIHDNNFDYSLVVFHNMRTKISIICNNCKLIFDQRPDHHLRKIGCPNCIHTVSKMETEWLNYMNVPNDQNHRQVPIKIGKHRYKIDGINLNFDTVYEFNGDYWHGNPNFFDPDDMNLKAKETFGNLLNRTIQKSKKLEKLGYKVISIWESDWLKVRANKKVL